MSYFTHWNNSKITATIVLYLTVTPAYQYSPISIQHWVCKEPCKRYCRNLLSINEIHSQRIQVQPILSRRSKLDFFQLRNQKDETGEEANDNTQSSDESFAELLSTSFSPPLDLPPPEELEGPPTKDTSELSLDETEFPEFVEDLPGFGGGGFFGLPGMPPLTGGMPGPPPGMGSGMMYDAEEIQSILSLHEEVLEDEARTASASGVVSSSDVMQAITTLTGNITESAPEKYQCFVEGMVFETTKEQIEKFFESAKPSEIIIPCGAGTPNKGVAYLTFENKEDLQTALSQNKKELDGRWLKVERFDTPLDEVTSIKVKNLPGGLTKTAFREIFSECGEIESVHIPTTRTIRRGVAFITYKEPAHAQKALEMDGVQIDGRYIDVSLKVTPVKTKQEEKERLVENEIGGEGEMPNNRRVHITGLNFQATEQDLEDFLCEKGFGPVETIQLPKFRTTTKNRGFGYITFENEEDAVKALNLTGQEYRGFELEVSPNRYKTVVIPEKKQKKEKKKTETQYYIKLDGDDMLYIGGIPFKATEESVKAWFESKGIEDISRVVVPHAVRNRKRNKGVAYVAIDSKEMKEKALELNGENMEGKWLMIKQMGAPEEGKLSNTQ